MEDIMVLAMPDTDMLDTHMPTMERDLLMPSMDTMDMPDLMPMDTEAMDTHTPMDTMERDPLMLSQRLMLTTDTMDMPDLMPLDTEVLDTEDTTTDKSYTLSKNSTKQKLKANNIQL